jgi:hypothetical protein
MDLGEKQFFKARESYNLVYDFQVYFYFSAENKLEVQE